MGGINPPLAVYFLPFFAAGFFVAFFPAPQPFVPHAIRLHPLSVDTIYIYRTTLPIVYTNSPSSVYLRCRCVALLDVPLGTPASAPRCRLGLHLECKLVWYLLNHIYSASRREFFGPNPGTPQDRFFVKPRTEIIDPSP